VPYSIHALPHTLVALQLGQQLRNLLVAYDLARLHQWNLCSANDPQTCDGQCGSNHRDAHAPSLMCVGGHTSCGSVLFLASQP
jgi:hypothetical protein